MTVCTDHMIERHNSGGDNIVTANLMQFQVDTFLLNLIKEQEQLKYDHKGLKYGVRPNRLFKSAISGGWMRCSHVNLSSSTSRSIYEIILHRSSGLDLQILIY